MYKILLCVLAVAITPLILTSAPDNLSTPLICVGSSEGELQIGSSEGSLGSSEGGCTVSDPTTGKCPEEHPQEPPDKLIDLAAASMKGEHAKEPVFEDFLIAKQPEDPGHVYPKDLEKDPCHGILTPLLSIEHGQDPGHQIPDKNILAEHYKDPGHQVPDKKIIATHGEKLVVQKILLATQDKDPCHHLAKADIQTDHAEEPNEEKMDIIATHGDKPVIQINLLAVNESYLREHVERPDNDHSENPLRITIPIIIPA